MKMLESSVLRYCLYGCGIIISSEVIYHSYFWLKKKLKDLSAAPEVCEIIWTNELSIYCAGKHMPHNAHSNAAGSTLSRLNKIITACKSSTQCENDFCAARNMGRLIALIDSTKYSIDLAMYTFTSFELSQAFLRALNRGVLVRVVSDHEMAYSTGSQIIPLTKAVRKMKDTTDILLKLRKLLQSNANAPLSAYIVPSDDAHQSEYICERDERRAYISGFDGSSGTAVVTMDKALLWTDGRYYQQALKQLDENWSLMKDGLPMTPSVGTWLAKNIPKGSVVGVDSKLLSYRAWKPIEEDLIAADCSLMPVEKNLIDVVWGTNQPNITSNPIATLDITFAGETIVNKWNKVKNQMGEKNCEAMVVSALDEIAWFLNLRGSDINYNPVFFAYLIITKDKLMFFVDKSKLAKNFHDHLLNNGVEIEIFPYESIGENLSSIANQSSGKIWISPNSSYYLNALVTKKKRHQEITAIAVSKAVKNKTEVEGFINCHIRDGLALCQYFAWLEHMLSNNQYVDEISGANKLEEYRSKQKHFMGLSFATISASGPNGSVIHYHPANETNRPITDKEIYLCDSGAQYLDGTTDVTRTIHFGNPSSFEKECYTRVLKGQLTLGSTVFPKKVKGQVLDTLARKALWDVGLDYGHGTGHGVGHFLNVHEGPMGVGVRLMPDDPGLQENMIISNEPGYYQDGEFGIRIEDLVQIVPADTKHDFNGRGALTFQTITLCPKQTKMIEKELLLESEVKMLNEYHRQVWNTLSPILKDQHDELTLSWLQRETQEI